MNRILAIALATSCYLYKNSPYLPPSRARFVISLPRSLRNDQSRAQCALLFCVLGLLFYEFPILTLIQFAIWQMADERGNVWTLEMPTANASVSLTPFLSASNLPIFPSIYLSLRIGFNRKFAGDVNLM